MVSCDYYQSDSGIIARLTFTVPAEIWVERISLVGETNAWNRDSQIMAEQNDGSHSVTIEVPAGPSYRFYYLCDGVAMSDSQADAFAPAPDGTPAFVVNTEPDAKRRAPRPSRPTTAPASASGSLSRQTPRS